MDWEKKKTEQAYLDGELTTSESIHYEEQLSPQKKRELEAEKALETAIVNKLGEGPKCPETLWASLQDQLQVRSRRSSILFFMPRMAVAATLAAVVLLAVWLGRTKPDPVQPESPRVVAIPTNLHEYVKLAQIQGRHDTLQQLVQHGFSDIHIKTPSPRIPGVHPVEIVGMRWIQKSSYRIAEIMFLCCKQPVSVYLIKKCEGNSDCIKLKECKKWYRISRDLGQYWVVALSYHFPRDAINLVAKRDI